MLCYFILVTLLGLGAFTVGFLSLGRTMWIP
jgi:hypothetical protein